MEMNKRGKTHPSQWIRFLDFAEKNPVVLTKKFEGPVGRDTYNHLWAELTISLNSMGYMVKSAEKWQIAVGDWKGKVKVKAAEIRMELQRTGGGRMEKHLTETEKRLIGLMGWTSIRGDGTLELGSPSTSTIPQQIPIIQVEHDYQFQVMPPNLRNIEVSPPPLIDLLEAGTSGYCETNPPQNSPVSMPNRIESRKRKVPTAKITSNFPKRNAATNFQNMHNETMGVLQEINSNIKRMADSQEELCKIHNKILDTLQKK